jgi:hypothetical protein
MASPQGSQEEALYQLKVRLRDSRPAIWRRFQVPGGTTLHRLHLILQAIMGWDHYHLYRFEIEGTQYGEPDPDNDLYGLHMKNSRRTKLARAVPEEGARFVYEYDFGDSWEHDLLVERILRGTRGISHPVCIEGKRACPPEDCGGIWGYDHLLEVIRDPTNEEHEQMMEWVGGHFDPEAFDLELTNDELRRMRLRR